jgi:hypothetical protein
MFRQPVRPLVAVFLLTTAALITLLIVQIFPLPANAANALSASIHHTVLPVNCTADLAQVGAVRHGAADRVDGLGCR